MKEKCSFIIPAKKTYGGEIKEPERPCNGNVGYKIEDGFYSCSAHLAAIVTARGRSVKVTPAKTRVQIEWAD